MSVTMSMLEGCGQVVAVTQKRQDCRNLSNNPSGFRRAPNFICHLRATCHSHKIGKTRIKFKVYESTPTTWSQKTERKGESKNKPPKACRQRNHLNKEMLPGESLTPSPPRSGGYCALPALHLLMQSHSSHLHSYDIPQFLSMMWIFWL